MLHNLQAMQSIVLNQFANQFRVVSQNPLNLLRCLIAAPQPNDFGRCPIETTALGEVGVLRDDAEPLGFRVFPDEFIGGLVQPGGSDVP